MIFPEKMKHLTAVTLHNYVEKVTKTLLSQGVLHFIDIKETDPQLKARLSSIEPEIPIIRLNEVLKRIDSLISTVSVKKELNKKNQNMYLDINQYKKINIENIEKKIDNLFNQIQSYRDKQNKINNKLLKFIDIQRQINLFDDIKQAITTKSDYSFLSIQVGSVQQNKISNIEAALKDNPYIILNFHEEAEKIDCIIVSMKSDQKHINTILDENGFTDITLKGNAVDLKQKILIDLQDNIKGLDKELEELKANSLLLIKKNLDLLNQLKTEIKLSLLYTDIQGYFAKTSRTVIFSGWIPVSKKEKLVKAITETTENKCFLYWSDPTEFEESELDKMKPPVKLKTPKILSPFKMLVTNYTIPEYKSIDPSIFVAIAYMCMFGLMFGDVGQGLVLIISGLCGLFFFSNQKESTRNLLKLIIYCGISAVIAGILFGSYFGMQWFKPLWFDYHGIIAGHGSDVGAINDVYGILVITIYFGIIIIYTGLLFNWINLIIKKKWFKLVFDKNGLLSGWIYTAGVYMGYYFVTHNFKGLPNSTTIFFSLGLPIILFILKPPIKHRLDSIKKNINVMTIINFIMEWMVEVFEILTGFMANTLSFIRVAGLGIAHASLMIAFFKISEMAAGDKSFTIGSIIILILGNALVIALEGLSAGIQSLRLNYYEFFSKYFSGRGIMYSPVSLKNK